ncbi:MAG TPA: hypothetical protein VFO07_06295 [Roseiflexaceae bacterium]|nr:hypothetical protein [Roseiflexaceae bacterium]
MHSEARHAKFRGCVLLASGAILLIMLACSLGYVGIQAGVASAPNFSVNLGNGRELRSVTSRGSCPGQNIELCAQWEYSIVFVARQYQAYRLISVPLKNGPP